MQMLPTTNFLGKEITRMIVGDNPQTGHSYIEDIIPGADMKAFYTPEKILETLFVIQDAGYNAILPLSNGSPFSASFIAAEITATLRRTASYSPSTCSFKPST